MTNSFSHSQMEQHNCQEEAANSEHPLKRQDQPGSDNLSGEFQGESEESQRAEPIDDVEAQSDFWSIVITLNHEYTLCAEGRNIPFHAGQNDYLPLFFSVDLFRD